MIHPSAKIHPTVQLFGIENIEIGENVRIDAFCVITAGLKGVKIGDHCHLSTGVRLMGAGARVELRRWVGLSVGVCLLSASDDFLDGSMTVPCVPEKFRHVISGDVLLEDHVVIGAHSVIFPGVTLHRGVSVGALSLIKTSVLPYHIVVGHKQRKVGERDAKKLAELESQFLCEYTSTASVGMKNP